MIKTKKILSIITAIMVGLTTVIVPTLAASNVYYAKTTVYFNVPSDATFSIAMPSNYASWTQIVGTTEGGATSTTWISFNFSSASSGTLVQPYEAGASGDAQNGALEPIYYIDNTGNVNEQFKIYLGTATPSGVALYVNATCGSCTSPLTTLTAVGVTEGSANTLTSSLANTDYLNITLYGNTSSATAGETNRVIYIKSTGL